MNRNIYINIHTGEIKELIKTETVGKGKYIIKVNILDDFSRWNDEQFNKHHVSLSLGEKRRRKEQTNERMD